MSLVGTKPAQHKYKTNLGHIIAQSAFNAKFKIPLLDAHTSNMLTFYHLAYMRASSMSSYIFVYGIPNIWEYIFGLFFVVFPASTDIRVHSFRHCTLHGNHNHSTECPLWPLWDNRHQIIIHMLVQHKYSMLYSYTYFVAFSLQLEVGALFRKKMWDVCAIKF